MKRVTLTLLAATLVLTSVSSFAKHAHKIKVNQHKRKQAKTILVRKAKPYFLIKLQSNLSTGYQWFLQKYDTHFIKAVSHQYLPPANMRPGAGGITVWRFQVNQDAFVAPHLLTVSLRYARPWDAQDGRDQTYTVVTSNK